MPGVMSRIGAESNGVNCILMNKENRGEILVNLFITSSSSHFFNKTNFEHYFLSSSRDVKVFVFFFFVLQLTELTETDSFFYIRQHFVLFWYGISYDQSVTGFIL